YITYESSIQNSGLAAFKGGKMISLFTLDEALIYNLLKDEFTNLLIETDEAVFSIDSELKPKYSVSIKETPKIKIKLTLSGEAKTGRDEFFKVPKYATEKLKASLEAKILSFLQKTQKEDCDILTISAHAKRKFLTEKEFKNYNWQKKYKNAEFEIDITFRNTKNSHGGNL
ncbi:MAG: Ger(x)C family spore germination C-terminal domain-containing protein, partial [Clostridia bacterium]|nr:Ger(x)C family spore germination C-terminal domain-containing protein [Clostridia bacterium]